MDSRENVLERVGVVIVVSQPLQGASVLPSLGSFFWVGNIVVGAPARLLWLTRVYGDPHTIRTETTAMLPAFVEIMSLTSHSCRAEALPRESWGFFRDRWL